MLPNHRDDKRLDELLNQPSCREDCSVLCCDKSGNDGFYQKPQMIPTRTVPDYTAKQGSLRSSSRSGAQSEQEIYESYFHTAVIITC
jgi:hypothetical protein